MTSAGKYTTGLLDISGKVCYNVLNAGQTAREILTNERVKTMKVLGINYSTYTSTYLHRKTVIAYKYDIVINGECHIRTYNHRLDYKGTCREIYKSNPAIKTVYIKYLGYEYYEE